MARFPRASLSRDAVLDAALTLVDRKGVEGLSVRGLARELGRPPMTLYAHFRSKQDLLDLLVERLVVRLFPAPHHATWQREVQEVVRHVRRELVEHPRWIALLTRATVPSAALDLGDRALGLLAERGFLPENAVLALSAVGFLALGSALVEQLMGGTSSSATQLLELVRETIVTLPRGTYPNLEAAAPELARWGFDEVFDLGLQSLVTGLDELLPRRSDRRRPA